MAAPVLICLGAALAGLYRPRYQNHHAAAVCEGRGRKNLRPAVQTGDHPRPPVSHACAPYRTLAVKRRRTGGTREFALQPPRYHL